MRAIIGLGNPGIKYKWNRHNFGFFVIDALAGINGIRFKRDRFVRGETGKGTIRGEETVLLKPRTFMNRSGEAVNELIRVYGVDRGDILVVGDDINLPWGSIRVRKQGSSGGHNGLQSIITAVGTNSFPRLRMGIGRPSERAGDVVEFVLGNFNRAEKKSLGECCDRAVRAIYSIFEEGIESAMNKFN